MVGEAYIAGVEIWLDSDDGSSLESHGGKPSQCSGSLQWRAEGAQEMGGHDGEDHSPSGPAPYSLQEEPRLQVEGGGRGPRGRDMLMY